MMCDAMSLQGRRVLITGAAGGIGGAVARVCGRLGARLVLSDRNPCPELLAELEELGVEAEHHICDVSDRREVEAVCRSVGPLDAAVLNAGMNPFDDWMDEDWDEAFRTVTNVNLLGSINVARAVLPALRMAGDGRLVLVGSVAGWTGGVMPTVPPHYVTAKAGIHALVRWLARRAAPEVLVNGVAPGPTRTAMTATQSDAAVRGQPVPRMAEPEEIAWPIAFLCAPASSFVCGTILDVNSGAYMR